ncbi:hypothetical protein [Streptomyces sp. NPDC048489]|uniref:hypothetical protein n=1 Tax=Streptomyces sp. NPDC048489 TaxID=3154504 RepID=UPI0034177E0D
MPEQQDQMDRVAALEEEIEQLRQETAWDVLLEISQTTNLKLRRIAEQFVRWPVMLQLPVELRRRLDAALEARRTAPRRSVPHAAAASSSRRSSHDPE